MNRFFLFLLLAFAAGFSSFTPKAHASGYDLYVTIDPTGPCYPNTTAINVASYTAFICGTDGGWHAMAGSSSGSTVTPSRASTCSSSLNLGFASSGDVAYDVTLTANCTISITPPAFNGTYRRLILVIRPAGFQVTLPAYSSALVWPGGVAPTPSTSNATILAFGSTGTAPMFGGI